MLRLLVLDPGQTCGLLQARGPGNDPSVCMTESVPLAALPARLLSVLRAGAAATQPGDETVLAYETFRLLPGKARQQGGSSMPASVGIGVLHGVAQSVGWGALGVHPACKTAGRAYAAKHLPSIAAARAAANNEHERDVCDLAGYVLRQRTLGKAPFA